jgi:agmatinase
VNVELSSGGIQSFLRAPLRSFDDIPEGTVAVFGVPTDWTLGTRPGTRYGPRAIRESSTQLAYYLHTARDGQMIDVRNGRPVQFDAGAARVVDLSDVPIFPVDVSRTAESIAAAESAVLRAGAFPVMLGGDHYVTYPAMRAFTEHVQEQGRRCGFIQLDAHFDLVDDNPVFGRHYHGSLSRRIAELPGIRPENMAWIGINGYVRVEQLEFVDSSGAWAATRQDVRRRGAGPVAADAIERAAAGCDEVYLSIDIDVVDGGAASGAGSVNVDGLTPGEFLDCVDILADAPLGGIDLVEVSPPLDPSGYTARLAALALSNLILRRLS